MLGGLGILWDTISGYLAIFGGLRIFLGFLWDSFDTIRGCLSIFGFRDLFGIFLGFMWDSFSHYFRLFGNFWGLRIFLGSI